MASPTITWGPGSGDRATATSLVITYPAGAANDVVYLYVGTKAGGTINAPAGSVVIVPPVTGGGQVVAVYGLAVASTASGTQTVTITNADTSSGFACRTPPGTSIPAYTTGSTATVSTNFSATALGSLSLATEDVLVGIVSYSNDATTFSGVIGENGPAVIGSTTTNVVSNMLNGSDMCLTASSAPVTTGGSSIPSISGTFGGGDTFGGSGIALFLHLRAPVVDAGKVTDVWNGTTLVRQKTERWTGSALVTHRADP